MHPIAHATLANSGDLDGTTVYFYEGQKICETRDGSGNMVAQFIHGTQYIDELVMMRAAGKGDLYVHQGERSERERAAIGTADRDVRDRPATCPQGDRTTRSTGGANFNVIGVTDLGGSLVERYVLTPYGELTVHQLSSYGDRDGDGDVDATDKGTPGTTCTGTPTGACRILDLDFDGDYDATDATLFDNLDAGNAVHPGRRFSALGQHFGHQGLWLDAEAGQYQNRARWLGSSVRRFGQRDPLPSPPAGGAGYHDGLNLTEYTKSDPLGTRDPTGKGAVEPPDAAEKKKKEDAELQKALRRVRKPRQQQIPQGSSSDVCTKPSLWYSGCVECQASPPGITCGSCDLRGWHGAPGVWAECDEVIGPQYERDLEIEDGYFCPSGELICRMVTVSTKECGGLGFGGKFNISGPLVCWGHHHETIEVCTCATQN